MALSEEDRRALVSLRSMAAVRPAVTIDAAVLRWLLDLVDEATLAPANRLVAQFHAQVASYQAERGQPMPRYLQLRRLDALLAGALREGELAADDALAIAGHEMRTKKEAQA